MNDEGQSERIEQLIGALRDDNEALRDHAIASLSQLGEEAIEPLIGLMADEDVLIREAATIAVVRDRRLPRSLPSSRSYRSCSPSTEMFPSCPNEAARKR